jgi:phage minor structural protein
MKTVITVYKGDELIFRGRVINEAVGFYKDKTFTCEGELGFLLDSIQRPYTFSGTPEELLTQFIESHNSQVDASKQFTVGTVTVTDPNDYITRSNSEYESTSDNLQSKLLDPLGGYIFITENSSGNRVINWYADSPYRSDQVIEFGENLLDFTKTNRAEDIATAIIPLGYEIEDETTGEKSRLTIADVNNGVDYVYNSDAVALYGWIFKVETWDDVTLASNLKTKGEAFLAEKIKQSITIELSAIDLSLMDQSIDSFRLGDYIRIISSPHNLDDNYLLEKQTIDLLKPDNDKITLGYTFSSFTDINASANNDNSSLIKTVETIKANYVTNEIVSSQVANLQSQIDQTPELVKITVSSEVSTNEELNERLATMYTQLNNTFEFMFNNLDTIVNDNDIDTRAKFSEINKYIRFVDGDIYIGEIGNPLTLKLSLDRISFLENDAEVAYISNNKIHITDANILNSLRIGNFAFIPKATGNLSIMKVRS